MKSKNFIPIYFLFFLLTSIWCADKQAPPQLDWLVEPQFDSAQDFSEHYGLGKKGDDLFIVDNKGKTRKLSGYSWSEIPHGYEMTIVPEVVRVSNGFFALVSKNDEKWHYLKARTLKELPGAWDYVYPFSEGKAIVFKDWKYYVINRKGDIVFELPVCEEFGHCGYQEGLLAVNKDSKWGYLDAVGKWIIAPQYDFAWHFDDGVAWVKKEKTWHAINKKGDILFSIPEFGELGWIKGRRALLEKDFDLDTSVDHGAIVHKDTDWILYDVFRGKLWTIKGSVNIEDYLAESPFCVFEKEGPSHYVDEFGTAISKQTYDWANPFYEGYAVVGHGHRYNQFGIINKRGELIVPFVLDEAGRASDGIIPAEYKGKTGYLKLK